MVKGKGKKRGALTKTDTITDTALASVESLDSNDGKGFDEILGTKTLPAPTEPHLLLRIRKGVVTKGLSEKIGMPESEFSNLKSAEIAAPMILGPYTLSKIRDWVMGGALEPDDGILPSFGHWKLLKTVFPEMSGDFEDLADITATGSVSLSSGFSELTPLPIEGGIQTDAENTPSPERSANLGKFREGEAPVQTKKIPLRRLPASAEHAKEEAQKLFLPWKSIAVGVLVLVGFASLLFLRKFKMVDENQAPEQTLGEIVMTKDLFPPDTKVRNWPASLKPRNLIDIYAADSTLERKIRPLMIAYQQGNTVLAEKDDELLRSVASPGSASWEARRLAANLLAVLELSRARIQLARNVLEPIYKIAQSDAVTVMNLSLLNLIEGKLGDARDLALSASRLCPPGLCWVAYSILGMVPSGEEFDRHFQNALSLSANNLVILGLWIQSSARISDNKGRIQQLLKEALFADPDRTVDSPIAAPLAGGIVISQAMEGLEMSSQQSSSLTRGQRSYFRWLKGRNRFNPLFEPLSRLMDNLKQESEPESQLLYAYAQKEEGKYAEALATMENVIPKLASMKRNSGSWPWSFYADLLMVQGDLKRAKENYLKALEINGRDAAAVYGLALVYREQGDFAQAEQKITETLSMDPMFLPAQLRVSRFAWHLLNNQAR